MNSFTIVGSKPEAPPHLLIFDIITDMKKIILILSILTISIYAKLQIVVSIIPEKTFVEAIGGNNVSISVMVKPGSSPHTYEPKPKQMQQVASAKLYLPIGVEFEKIWLSKFKDLNPNLIFADLSKGIERIPMQEKSSAKATSLDPHIWIAPSNVKIIAKNILETLIASDPKHEQEYKNNYQKFVAKIDQTDKRISQILKSSKGGTFMVFHPSWGYFAKEYNLRQLPVQIAGKNPKPKDLISLIKQAREAKVKAVFTQPETPDNMVKVLADELKVPVVKISPMAPDWSANLLKLAHAIAGQKEDK